MKLTVGALECWFLTAFGIVGLWATRMSSGDHAGDASAKLGAFTFVIVFPILAIILMVRAKRRDATVNTAYLRQQQWEQAKGQEQQWAIQSAPNGAWPAQAANGSWPSQAAPAGPVMPFVPGIQLPGQVVETPNGLFMVGTKSKKAAALLGIFLGWVGGGAFYRGVYTGTDQSSFRYPRGLVQLIVCIFTVGIGLVWPWSEAIMVLLAKPGEPESLDAAGELMT